MTPGLHLELSIAMLDITFRPLKDRIFDPLCTLIPAYISPAHITFYAFFCGITCIYYAATCRPYTSLLFWILNRALDCLDGALARHHNQASDLGGFFDLLCDFIIYSAVPIACALARDGPALADGERSRLWLAVTVLEATFHVNNFVLFYIAAILEKRKAAALAAKGNEKMLVDEGVKELTSVAMRPALIEGMESGILFTLMLVMPQRTELIAWVMGGAVFVGIVQRTIWVVPVLSGRPDHKKA